MVLPVQVSLALSPIQLQPISPGGSRPHSSMIIRLQLTTTMFCYIYLTAPPPAGLLRRLPKPPFLASRPARALVRRAIPAGFRVWRAARWRRARARVRLPAPLPVRAVHLLLRHRHARERPARAAYGRRLQDVLADVRARRGIEDGLLPALRRIRKLDVKLF